MELQEIVERMTSDPVFVNKEMIRRYGAAAAFVYGELKSRSEAAGGREFICSQDDLEYECSVTPGRQKKILRKLEADGYIRVTVKGFPHHRYIEVLK